MDTSKVIAEILQIREKRLSPSINGKVTNDYIETVKLESKFLPHTKRN